MGVKDIHIAILTEDTASGAIYETSEKLERAISAKL